MEINTFLFPWWTLMVLCVWELSLYIILISHVNWWGHLLGRFWCRTLKVKNSLLLKVILMDFDKRHFWYKAYRIQHCQTWQHWGRLLSFKNKIFANKFTEYLPRTKISVRCNAIPFLVCFQFSFYFNVNEENMLHF